MFMYFGIQTGYNSLIETYNNNTTIGYVKHNFLSKHYQLKLEQ